MKKLLLVAASLAIVAASAFAQEQPQGQVQTQTQTQKKIYPDNDWKRWTVSAGIGTQFYMGENDWKAKFKDWWSGPAVDLYISKYVTPYLGFGLGFTYSPMRGLYNQENESAAFKTDEYVMSYYGYDHLYRQKTNTFNPYLVALLNLNNLFAGYKPDRVYNCTLYLGGGVILGPDSGKTRCGGTFNMGLLNTFTVSKNIDILVNLRGGIVSDKFDGEVATKATNILVDGIAGITAGVVIHFGKTTAAAND